MKFVLYTYIGSYLQKVGEGEYESPEQAFKQIVGGSYQLEIQDHQFSLYQHDESTYHISTNRFDYVLKIIS